MNFQSDSTRGQGSRFGLRCHFDREIGVEDSENGKSSKLFLALKIILSEEEEEESNDDS